MKSFIIKSWPKIIKYIFGPIILLLLFWSIGIQKLWALIISADQKYFVIAYVLFILSVFIAAMNLYALFYPLRKIDTKRFLQYFFASRITSLVLPGRLGEFSITLYLKKEGINLGRGLAAVITDKLITISCSIIFGLIAIHVLMEKKVSTIFGETNMYLTTLYVVIALVVFAFFSSKTSRELFKKLILRKYAHHFEGFSTTLFSYLQENKSMAFLNLLITLGRIVVIALSARAMFLALGTDISLVTLILVGGLETLSTFIPLTINGLGIKQAVGIYVFSALGISPVVTGARYVMGLFIQYSFGFLSTFFIKNDLLQEHETAH